MFWKQPLIFYSTKADTLWLVTENAKKLYSYIDNNQIRNSGFWFLRLLIDSCILSPSLLTFLNFVLIIYANPQTVGYGMMSFICDVKHVMTSLNRTACGHNCTWFLWQYFHQTAPLKPTIYPLLKTFAVMYVFVVIF